MKRPKKTDFKKRIREKGGNVSSIARSYNVTRETIYQWRNHFKLSAYIKEQRNDMQEIATDVIYDQLFDEDPDVRFRSASFVKTRLGENGATIFPPDVLVILAGLGKTPQNAVDEFIAMMRHHASQKADA